MGSTACVQRWPRGLQDLVVLLLGLLLIHLVVLWPGLQGQAFAQPRIDSIGPNPGIIGEPVTIVGRGFDGSSPSNNIINYGRLSIPAESVDAAGTRLTVTFAKAPVTGPITISSVTPSILPVGGGGVLITGQNFPGAPMPLTVTVGGLPSNAVNFLLSGITRVLVDVLTRFDSLLFINLGNGARFPFTANVTSPTSMSVTIPPLLSLAPPPGQDLFLPGGIRVGFLRLLIKFFDGSLSNLVSFPFPQLTVFDPGLFTPEAPLVRLPPAPIQCGQTISRPISQQMEFHRFEFQGQEGEIVTIAMHGMGGLDPELILFGPGPLSEFLPPPRLLTGDDDSGPGLDALLSKVRLPASGTYTIEARSSFSTGFRTTGPYSLTLICGQLELVANIAPNLNPNDPSNPRTPVSEGETKTARVPLGSPFFIRLVKKDQSGNRIPVRSTFTLEPATIAPSISEPTLFKNNAAIMFDRQSADDKKFFQAVHRGDVMLNITPTDASIRPVKVRIEVTKPASLGTTNNVVTDRRTGESYNLDERLVDLGHRRGIPPHFLKGQVQKESSFNLRSYRYEPLTSDLLYMSTCRLRSRNCNLRTQRPYELYRLATSDGLLDGTNLRRPDDISPRSIYCILERHGTRRRIADADQFISAEQIFAANDMVPRGDPSGCVSQNWSSPENVSDRILDAVANNPALLDFTAQTTIAASYGLLQILYPTAISPMRWEGVAGAQNPSILFDTESNLARGGGSLLLGSGYLRRVFSRANIGVSVDDPDFPSRDELERRFRRAFNLYNGQKKENLDTGRYGREVLSFSESYLPPSSAIFP